MDGDAAARIEYLTYRLSQAEQLIDHLCTALNCLPSSIGDMLSDAGYECYRKWFGLDEEEGDE